MSQTRSRHPSAFLSRLQQCRGPSRKLQAEDIVVRAKTDISSQVLSKSSNAKKRSHTSIFLTEREPSREGLLAELTGLHEESSTAATLSSAKSKVHRDETPWWVSASPRHTPHLDRLIPAARSILHEMFSHETRHSDISNAIKRAVTTAVQRLSDEVRFSSRDSQEAIQELSSLLLGKGPLQVLYEDALVTDIYIDAFDKIRCLRLGHSLDTPFRFRSKGEYEAFATAMLQSAHRVLSATNPVVDCVLEDSWRTRVNGVHASVREGGENAFVLRVPRLRFASLYDLLKSQTMPAPLAAWLAEFVSFGEGNILVMGPTGSGKTTLTTALLSSVGSDERVCTIEEIPEIFVSGCHLEKLFTSPKGVKDLTSIGIEELLRAALRRAPHRIVIGEIRDKEGALFLEALETGHSGSIATMHAENPVEGLWRLLDMIATQQKASLEVIQRRIKRAVQIVLVMQRINGRPCLVDVSEVVVSEHNGFEVKKLIEYEGEVKGKRRWRRLAENSEMLEALTQRGVELLTSPSLVGPPKQETPVVTESVHE